MPAVANEGAVLAMLAELAQRADAYGEELTTRLAGADAVRATITETLDRLQGSRAKLRELKTELTQQLQVRDVSVGRAAEAGEVVARADRRIKELNQMMEYGIEDEQLFAEMGRAGKARSDKSAERDKQRLRADKAEQRSKECESLIFELSREVEAFASDIKKLQKDLPDPHLFAWLGLSHIGRANAHFRLDGDMTKYDRGVRFGAEKVRQLHSELRQGRYRLDRYGDLLAGRHDASVQAIYAAAALGDMKLAGELFSLTADPGMYFHQIFNVYRTWLLGAYLLGDKTVMQQLLRAHKYDQGLWNGYVRAFSGLVDNNRAEFEKGLLSILKIEKRQEPLDGIPGIGLVHLPAAAIARLGRAKNWRVALDDERVPKELLEW